MAFAMCALSSSDLRNQGFSQGCTNSVATLRKAVDHISVVICSSFGAASQLSLHLDLH